VEVREAEVREAAREEANGDLCPQEDVSRAQAPEAVGPARAKARVRARAADPSVPEGHAEG